MKTRAPSAPPFDAASVREDFPILDTQVGAHALVYLDNAATAQKPQAVIDAVSHYYASTNANIHRGVHYLSGEATDAYDKARVTVANFLNAAEPRECIFVRGTTEAINLVASSWGRTNLKKGDEILLTTMEHHANIVPWQLVAAATGAIIKVIPITDRGELELSQLDQLLTPKVKLLAVTQISNALGTINPVRELVQKAHKVGALVLVDGAQSTPHLRVDVRALDCDFFAFSGHKVFGPTGIGVLYGKAALLEKMPPYQGGGDMIDRVTFEKTTFRGLPERFEAGTPDISGAIGLAAAIHYLAKFDHSALAAYESDLLTYATEAVANVNGVRLIGEAPEKAGVLSFVMEGVHPHDIGTVLDSVGIAIRAGHHCCQPLMKRLGLAGTARASFAFYNTRTEADRLADALVKVKKMFG
ncbi:MAG TPA: cysteine desulfurase [Opitutales bacterium]|nr:cysteine desulfurase [Opitutales bacterium]